MVLGFDTSNYTTSVAAFDGVVMQQQKQLLHVKNGARGLRQSEMVFQHTVHLPVLLEKLETKPLEAVGVSVRPRNAEGSYMPCFLAGESAAAAAAKAAGVPLYKTSHQVGHILAALYANNDLSWTQQPFLAFHLSGGTTEALLVEPHAEEIISATCIARSTDLKAGQAIDRTGVMLGFPFPAGKALDALAQEWTETFSFRLSMQGADCSLSGIENKARKMHEANEPPARIARYVLSFIAETIACMTQRLIAQYGELPLVFSGGVSANSLLRARIAQSFDACFAAPAYALDNAAGCAVYAMMKSEKI